MLNINDDDLCALWHGHLPNDQICAELNVTAHELNRLWLRLRKQGKLPRRPRKPFRVQDHIDGRPIALNHTKVDPLLAALIEHHTQPRYDLYPGAK